jgi:hypothetical protein
MIRQYHGQRRQGGHSPLGIGVMPAGAIFYLQSDCWWRDCYRGKPACRNPWIVEGFLNGTLAAARRNPLTGRCEDIYVARRSDFALLRSLRHGRRQVVAVRVLILHEDEGLRCDGGAYPDVPSGHTVQSCQRTGCGDSSDVR